MENNKECAKIFCDAIRGISRKPENIDNFESYLGDHFDVWLRGYANTPEGLASEMKMFAEMEI